MRDTSLVSALSSGASRAARQRCSPYVIGHGKAIGSVGSRRRRRLCVAGKGQSAGQQENARPRSSPPATARKRRYPQSLCHGTTSALNVRISPTF